MNRKSIVIFIITLVCVTLAGSVAAQSDKPEAVDAAVSAAFTYQGQLRQGGAAVNGSCDMAFRLYDNASAGNLFGSPITTTLSVNNGLFTVGLNFGYFWFSKDATRWLDIRVRCPAGSGSYTTLTPRQPITAAPYALYALAPWVTAGNNLWYYPAGNVGIGTTIPERSLHVLGENAGLRLQSGSLQAWTTVEYYADSRIWHTGVGGSEVSNDVKSKYYILDGTASQFRMVIDTGGNVGIGTTNPQRSLHVSGVNSGLRLQSSNNTLWTTTEYQTDARIWHTGVGGSVVPNDVKSKYYIFDGTASQFRMVIDTDGNVGIGETAPSAKLVVHGEGSLGTVFRAVDANGTMGLSVAHGGYVTIGALGGPSTAHVCHNAGRLAACNSAAEYVPSIDGGYGYPQTADLVSIAPAVSNPYGDTHAPFAVEKAATSCDPNLLGFIVNPELGADGKKLNDHYLPLAIYGYFPAKVTVENGPIKRGDALTSSSKPGYAMKATQACKTIGYALEDADHDGMIQVFAGHGENAASEVAVLRTQVQELRQTVADLKQENAALDARLTALEQTMSAQAPTQSAAPRVDNRGSR